MAFGPIATADAYTDEGPEGDRMLAGQRGDRQICFADDDVGSDTAVVSEGMSAGRVRE